MPPTRLLDQKSKKAEKCVFFAAGFKNIIVLKNKKTYKSVFFLFYINVTAKKNQPPTQNFEKISKIT